MHERAIRVRRLVGATVGIPLVALVGLYIYSLVDARGRCWTLYDNYACPFAEALLSHVYPVVVFGGLIVALPLAVGVFFVYLLWMVWRGRRKRSGEADR